MRPAIAWVGLMTAPHACQRGPHGLATQIDGCYHHSFEQNQSHAVHSAFINWRRRKLAPDARPATRADEVIWLTLQVVCKLFDQTFDMTLF